ncbi:MAG TPA: dihydrofolate reductase family protein [Gemmatimonadaceae bacterium]|jgi:dihydrofolate reductase|nr:dihydrofolate reductase family protein [Gemmatimonadaceae bacterium]
MRKINVTNNVTLDGVMQAPGSANEDTRNGFTRGGWAAPYHDEVKMKIMGRGMARRGALLFGRHTYEHFFKVWPGRTDNPYTEVLDNTQKYVVSRTLKEPLPWKNSTLLAGDAEDTVAALKNDPGVDLTILGSGELVRSLVRCNLIDQFILLIHPLVLGSGQRMFGDDGTLAKFTLTESVPTTTGVIIATYERA